MCPKTSRVNDSFGYSLVVKVLDLLQKNVVFKECGAKVTGFQRVLIIGNDCTALSCKGRTRTSCELMQLSAIARNFTWFFLLRFAFNGELPWCHGHASLVPLTTFCMGTACRNLARTGTRAART